MYLITSTAMPRFAPTKLTSTMITEYFHKLRMEQTTKNLELSWKEEEDDWFSDWTRGYRGEGGEDTNISLVEPVEDNIVNNVAAVEQSGYVTSSLLTEGSNQDQLVEVKKKNHVELEGVEETLRLDNNVVNEDPVEQQEYVTSSLCIEGSNSEDDLSKNKDDFDDWKGSLSDQDDLYDIYTSMMGHEDNSTMTNKDNPDPLPTKRSEGQEGVKVPDCRTPPSVSRMENTIVVQDGQSTTHCAN